MGTIKKKRAKRPSNCSEHDQFVGILAEESTLRLLREAASEEGVDICELFRRALEEKCERDQVFPPPS
jgi:hypothetical protein